MASTPSPALAPNKLLGAVQVQPATIQAGESVLVQVCDINNRPYQPNSGVRITIDGIEAVSRYYQYATAGTRKLTVRAVQGQTVETAVASVQVSDPALSFRRTLTQPALSAMPIIQVTQPLGKPYLATFTLGTPSNLQASLAQAHPTTVPVGVAAPTGLTPAGTSAAVESAASIAISVAPPAQITKIPPTSTVTKAGLTVTTSGSFLPVAPLQIQPVATSYKWTFGDGTTATTQSPTVTHDYFSAIKADQIPHSFDVSCTVVHDNFTVTRTLVLFSAYGLCKRFGTVVPQVTGDAYATYQKVGFSGSLIVHNIEAQTITLTDMAVVPLNDDASAQLPNPQFTAMKVPIVIAPNAATAIGVYLLNSQIQQLSNLGPNVPGFTVYYKGTLAAPAIAIEEPVIATRVDSTIAERATTPVLTNPIRPVVTPPLRPGGAAAPVRFSWTFHISLTDSGLASAATLHAGGVSPVDSAAALQAVSAVAAKAFGGLREVGTQTMDPATNTVAIPLSANASSPTTLAAVHSSVQAGLTSIAIGHGVITPEGAPLAQPVRPALGANIVPPIIRPLAPPQPGPVAAGQVCDPDNISAADAASASTQSLVCQLTDQTKTVLMPGSFQNALMGDVILSPGGDGGDQIIASLLRALDPPQYHSHSGIMTQNFFQITHCTADASRYGRNTQGIEGAGGIQPDVLEFGWPGSITQSIDHATNGQNWVDPADGNPYNIGGFTPNALGIISNGQFILVPPLVVKPLPENEATARPILRNVAVTALSKGAQVDNSGNLTQKGGCYYCFYGYTKPEIALDFTDTAPASAGWAQGLSPAVCSSFVWLCMKESNAHLVTQNQYETPADLSSSAVAAGAAVGAQTLDGLFFYSDAERAQAAQLLDQIFQNQVLQEEGIFSYFPLLSSDIAMNIADQIMNAFASNNTDGYGSDAWKNPGPANAVSPDNIQWWNGPLFGYAEPLQFLQQHTEQYTVSEWTKVVTTGTISGNVTYGGTPVNGAHVYVYDGKGATTDANGYFQLSNVPSGNYDIYASAVINGFEYSNGLQGQPLTLAANQHLTLDIALAGLPEVYRTLDLVYQISCDHGDANWFNTHGVQYAGPDEQSCGLGPGQIANSCWYNYDYNNGGYFSIAYQILGVLAEDLSIQVTIFAAMTNAGGNSPNGQTSITFNVPKGGQYAWEIDLEVKGFTYHNGLAKFTGTATNQQETT